MEATQTSTATGPFAEISLTSLALMALGGVHLWLATGHGWSVVLHLLTGFPYVLAVSILCGVAACLRREALGLVALGVALLATGMYGLLL